MKIRQNKDHNFIIRMLNLSTIKSKFLVPISLTLVILFTLLDVGFIQYYNRKAEKKLNNDIEMITALETQLLDVPVWNYNEEHIEEVVKYSFKNKEVVYIKVYDDEEETDLLSGYCRDKEWGIKTWKDDSIIDDPYLITQKATINRIVEDKNIIIGLVEMGFTSKFYQKEKITTALFIMLFGLFVLAMVIGLLIVITKVITNPIHKLTDIVVRSSEDVHDENILSTIIASSNQLEKAEIYSNDETGKLALAFNIMMKQLEKSLKKLNREMVERKRAEELLQKAYDQQELRIQERTSKLSKANEELEIEIKVRKQAEEALKESEEKYRTQFEETLDAIFIADAETGILIDCNHAGSQLVARVRSELVGKHQSILHPPEEIEGELSRTFKQHLEEKEGQALEAQIITKNGEIRDVSIKANIYEVKGKKVLQGIFRDITERKRAEEEKKKIQAQLQRAEKMEAVGTLAGGVAHDLNNILSGLVSYPELLLMDIPEDSPLRNPILIMQNSGEKAVAIVQDLLTLARRGVTVTEISNLNDIITNYLKSPEHEKIQEFHPNVQFETSFETSLLNILGSPVHLSKTVMNLTSNAAEALLDGGKVTITTKNQYIDRPIRGYDDVNQGDYVVLIVADNGIGISAEDLESIFEQGFHPKLI